MLVERRLIKYRGCLACTQEQICILRAWAVTLMFYTVQTWQRHSQKTLFVEKMLTVPSGRRGRLLSQRTHVDAHSFSYKRDAHTPEQKKKSFLLTQLPIWPRDHMHHNSRFLLKLGLALSSGVTQGRGDDNDVYEV